MKSGSQNYRKSSIYNGIKRIVLTTGISSQITLILRLILAPQNGIPGCWYYSKREGKAAALGPITFSPSGHVI